MMPLFMEARTDLYQRIQQVLPSVMTALLLVLAGWALAVVLRAVLIRFVGGVTARLASNQKYSVSLVYPISQRVE